MDYKTVAKLRGWMQKYGHGGTLLAGAYLLLHHLHAKRHTALILSAAGCLALSALFLWPQSHHAVKLVAPPAPLSQVAPLPPVIDLNAALRDAVRHNDLPHAGAALSAGADVDAADEKGDTPLLLAVERDQESIVRLLLQKDAESEAALSLAVDHKNIVIVRLLLEHRFSAQGPEQSGIDSNLTALASANGSNEILRLLLAHSAPLDGYYGEGLTPLKAAADHHHRNTIQLLLAHGVDVNEDRGAEGTALAYVAEKGDLPMVKFLVTRGADVNDRSQHTAVLHMAVGHPEIVRYLLRHGADVDRLDRDNFTPLIAAAGEGKNATVKILLDYGADINSRSTRDGTALTIAAAAGHTDVVKTLLCAGADVTLSSTEKDDTALEAAQDNHHPAIVRLLKQAGARK